MLVGSVNIENLREEKQDLPEGCSWGRLYTLWVTLLVNFPSTYGESAATREEGAGVSGVNTVRFKLLVPKATTTY
jgi:hypothetical protein